MRVRLRVQSCIVVRLFLTCFARCEGGAGQRAHAAEKDEDEEEDAQAKPAKAKVQNRGCVSMCAVADARARVPTHERRSVDP